MFSFQGEALRAVRRDTLDVDSDGDETDDKGAPDGEDPSNTETIEEKQARVVDPLRTRLLNEMNATEVDLALEVFYHDKFISEAAQYHGIDPEERVERIAHKVVQFTLPFSRLNKWMDYHHNYISIESILGTTSVFSA
ncbi:hypothetical protein BGX33_009444 [Mortierella sp. NVP41]|nr:hypothetical protein BGX33_009444 [Mortierella sp. NVP41]